MGNVFSDPEDAFIQGLYNLEQGFEREWEKPPEVILADVGGEALNINYNFAPWAIPFLLAGPDFKPLGDWTPGHFNIGSLDPTLKQFIEDQAMIVLAVTSENPAMMAFAVSQSAADFFQDPQLSVQNFLNQQLGDTAGYYVGFAAQVAGGFRPGGKPAGELETDPTKAVAKAALADEATKPPQADVTKPSWTDRFVDYYRKSAATAAAGEESARPSIEMSTRFGPKVYNEPTAPAERPFERTYRGPSQEMLDAKYNEPEPTTTRGSPSSIFSKLQETVRNWLKGDSSVELTRYAEKQIQAPEGRVANHVYLGPDFEKLVEPRQRQFYREMLREAKQNASKNDVRTLPDQASKGYFHQADLAKLETMYDRLSYIRHLRILGRMMQLGPRLKQIEARSEQMNMHQQVSNKLSKVQNELQHELALRGNALDQALQAKGLTREDLPFVRENASRTAALRSAEQAFASVREGSMESMVEQLQTIKNKYRATKFASEINKLYRQRFNELHDESQRVIDAGPQRSLFFRMAQGADEVAQRFNETGPGRFLKQGTDFAIDKTMDLGQKAWLKLSNSQDLIRQHVPIVDRALTSATRLYGRTGGRIISRPIKNIGRRIQRSLGIEPSELHSVLPTQEELIREAEFVSPEATEFVRNTSLFREAMGQQLSEFAQSTERGIRSFADRAMKWWTADPRVGSGPMQRWTEPSSRVGNIRASGTNEPTAADRTAFADKYLERNVVGTDMKEAPEDLALRERLNRIQNEDRPIPQQEPTAEQNSLLHVVDMAVRAETSQILQRVLTDHLQSNSLGHTFDRLATDLSDAEKLTSSPPLRASLELWSQSMLDASKDPQKQLEITRDMQHTLTDLTLKLQSVRDVSLPRFRAIYDSLRDVSRSITRGITERIFETGKMNEEAGNVMSRLLSKLASQGHESFLEQSMDPFSEPPSEQDTAHFVADAQRELQRTYAEAPWELVEREEAKQDQVRRTIAGNLFSGLTPVLRHLFPRPLDIAMAYLGVRLADLTRFNPFIYIFRDTLNLVKSTINAIIMRGLRNAFRSFTEQEPTPKPAPVIPDEPVTPPTPSVFSRKPTRDQETIAEASVDDEPLPDPTIIHPLKKRPLPATPILAAHPHKKRKVFGKEVY